MGKRNQPQYFPTPMKSNLEIRQDRNPSGKELTAAAFLGILSYVADSTRYCGEPSEGNKMLLP